MPRQFLNPAPVLHDILGIDPAFNGSLTFYEIGTTTPKVTYADYDMSVPNENPVPLDSAARSSTQIWLDGEYTVVLKNDADETVWTRDLRPEQAGGDALPAKEAGKFLTTDGDNWLMQAISQLPDQTGSAGRVLSTDGANAIWVTAASVMPAPPEPDTSVTASRIVIGDGTNRAQILRGTGVTSTGVGTKQAQGSVAYSHPFSEAVVPMVTPTGGPFAPGNGVSGYWGDVSVTAYDANGFTFIVNTNHGESNSDGNISGAITVGYIAMGPIA